MKKIIILSVLLLTSALYAQTMMSVGLGGEYNYSTATEYDTVGNWLLNTVLPNEPGKPAHSLLLMLEGEASNLLSSGLTYGVEGGMGFGISTRSMMEFQFQVSPIIGYSFINDKLMQIYVNPVAIYFNPFYQEGIDRDVIATQILDFKTGLSFTFSDLGLRNETAEGYKIGLTVNWGQVRFNSGHKGYRTDLGFGLSFSTKNSKFNFWD